MDKMEYPRGLVRYTTQNAIKNNWNKREMWQRVMRPRIQIYSIVLVSIVLGLLVSLGLRTPFKVDVVRDRSTLSRITEEGTLENVYSLQIMNASEKEQTYQIKVRGLPSIKLKSPSNLVVAPAQSRWVVVRADIPYGSSSPGSHPIAFEIQAVNTPDFVVEKSVFIVPR
jgi:polyferredoxin